MNDLESRYKALLDQARNLGCLAANVGERTYECDISDPCSLCRLRTDIRVLLFNKSVRDAIYYGWTHGLSDGDEAVVARIKSFLGDP